MSRFVTEHEDDIYPVLVWIASSYAVAFTSGYIAEFILRQLGYTASTTVKVVGGGSVSHVPMTTAEYYAGMVSVAILLSTLSAWYYRNHRYQNGSGST